MQSGVKFRLESGSDVMQLAHRSYSEGHHLVVKLFTRILLMDILHIV